MLGNYAVGTHMTVLEYDISNLAEGVYIAYFHISHISEMNELRDLDQADKIYFEIVSDKEEQTNWKRQYWGSVRLNALELRENV